MWGWKSLGRRISRSASTSAAGATWTLSSMTKASESTSAFNAVQESAQNRGSRTKTAAEKALNEQEVGTDRPKDRLHEDKAEIAARNGQATAAEELGGKVLRQWKPNGDDSGPELLVMQGDLTASKADAVVNAANTRLMHGGGLAGAIVRRGGLSIRKESSAWIKQHGELSVGDAVTTAAGKLPCKHVIHTAGPNLGHLSSPTAEHEAQLRRAVWNALSEADRLGLSSVAVPGISTGIFGYPRDLGAHEIVREAVRFCAERRSTPLRRIAFMNIDDPTVSSFVKALDGVKSKAGVGTDDQLISEKLSRLNISD